jgi:hypothetical protein
MLLAANVTTRKCSVFHLTRFQLAPHELVTSFIDETTETLALQPVFKALYPVSLKVRPAFASVVLASLFERGSGEAKAPSPYERAVA